MDNHPGRFRLINDETYNEYKESFQLQPKSSGEVDFDNGKNWSGYHYPYRRGSLYEMKGMNVIDKLNCIGEIELVEYLTLLQHKLIRENEGLDWGGNCHGYCISSTYFVEPNSVTIDNIEFTQPEIKSLLSYFADEYGKSIDLIGQRCKSDLQMTYLERIKKDIMISQGEYDDPCDGINPASFHISLKRMIGNHKKSFVMDLDNSYHVWNYPIVGYESKVLDYHNNNIYHIETKVSYLGYQHPNDDTEVPGKESQKIQTVTFEYTLITDNFGVIKGGKWISDNYPDFVWSFNNKLPVPTGKWEILNKF